MAAKVERCARCGRRRRSGIDWAVEIGDFDDSGFGVADVLYCPECTTTEEHIQREINDATTDYIWRGERVAMYPKRDE